MPLPRPGSWGWALSSAVHQTEAEPQEVPGKAGPYWLHALVGEGGQGAAYLATGDIAGQTATCVVKRFRCDDDPDTVERVRRSLETQLRTVNSTFSRQFPTPFVPSVLSYDLGDFVSPWVAYEYCGPSLDTYLHKKPLARPSGASAGRAEVDERRDRLLQLAGSLALAVHRLHQVEVVHRDVKPSNVLVEPRSYRPRLRLCDLDLARRDHEPRLTVTGQGLGTLDYSAPEQLAGHRATVDSDVYAVGATLVFAAAGRPPKAAWLRREGISLLDADLRVDFGDEVADWVEGALHVDPSQRPSLRELIDLARPHRLSGGEGRPARPYPGRPTPRSSG